MPEQKGLHIIHTLADKWSRNNLLASLLNALALAVVVAAMGQYIFHLPGWITLALLVVTVILRIWLKPSRTITLADTSSFLNRSYPQLEESAHLALLPKESLGLLQQMQLRKTEQSLLTIPEPAAMWQPLKKAAFMLGGAVAASVLIYLLSSLLLKNNQAKTVHQPADTITPETILPGIAGVEIQITPPAYTNHPGRQQQQFSLAVEEGSLVQWKIRTNQKVNNLQLLFNSQEAMGLQPENQDSTTWILQKNIKEAGFYQLSLSGQPSQLYKLEVVPDLPVNIRIVAPEQYTTIEPGSAPLTKLTVHLYDDYGIRNAGIVATKASGKGESVRFKEQQLSFPVPIAGQQQIVLGKVLDLPALGLQAGDELYFYVKALDNHGQESRSDMYFISLPDTAALLSMSGMESGVNQVPEYFRSQRQIIIDIEKLLREQPVVPADSFKDKSNELGTDQKLLRLRYGKFLGEEFESGVHSPDDGHDHGSDEVEYGNIEALMEQYAHKHDNAEDATYFDQEQKTQLKAILTEMWSSELKLRTYFPREALPYAYKALRLLKDMQQKSRAYVSKTSIKMPPLLLEKRLTGELDQIISPSNRKNNDTDDEPETVLQKALSILEQLKQQPTISTGDQLVLMGAEKKISEKVIRMPGDYLPALSAMRTIVQQGSKAGKPAIIRVQAALQKILKAGELLPQKKDIPAGEGLSNYYFNNLNSSK
jgi:hypothetical protein